MKKASLATLAVALLSSCYFQVPYGRAEFPKKGYDLVFEQKIEDEGRTDIYELKCVEMYKKTAKSHDEAVQALETMVSKQGYTLQGRFIFTDDAGRACAFDRVQKEGNAKTTVTSYALEFTFAVPKGETYNVLCGNTSETVKEKKHYGSHTFFDSAENGCVFSGFPEVEVKK